MSLSLPEQKTMGLDQIRSTAFCITYHYITLPPSEGPWGPIKKDIWDFFHLGYRPPSLWMVFQKLLLWAPRGCKGKLRFFFISFFLLYSPENERMSTLKRDDFNRKYVFQPLIFRGHSLVFRGVSYWCQVFFEKCIGICKVLMGPNSFTIATHWMGRKHNPPNLFLGRTITLMSGANLSELFSPSTTKKTVPSLPSKNWRMSTPKWHHHLKPEIPLQLFN